MNRLLLERYYKLILEQGQGVIDLTNYKVKYSKEDKQAQLIRLANQIVKQYIKDGSKGGLYLNSTPITELPAGLKVEGRLDLTNTPITELPADLKVGSYLFLTNTPIAKKYTIEQLKQMLPGVKGGIYI
jgi:hypothetical protein